MEPALPAPRVRPASLGRQRQSRRAQVRQRAGRWRAAWQGRGRGVEARAPPRVRGMRHVTPSDRPRTGPVSRQARGCACIPFPRKAMPHVERLADTGMQVRSRTRFRPVQNGKPGAGPGASRRRRRGVDSPRMREGRSEIGPRFGFPGCEAHPSAAWLRECPRPIGNRPRTYADPVRAVILSGSVVHSAVLRRISGRAETRSIEPPPRVGGRAPFSGA
jgi:hypothetical protein